MEQIPRKQQGDPQSEHTEQEVVDRLCHQQFPAAHRGCEHAFHVAVFVFAGHQHGGQLGSDQGHDDDNDAGDHEVCALIGVVEPHAALHPDAGRGGGRAENGEKDSPDIVVTQTRLTAVGPVQHDQDRQIPRGKTALRIGRQKQTGIGAMASNRLLPLLRRAHHTHVEILGCPETGDEFRTELRPDRLHDRQLDIADVQRQTVSEQEQQEHRQQNTHNHTAAVAQQLPALLDDQNAEPSEIHSAPSLSPRPLRMMLTNASSSDGSAPSFSRPISRISATVPEATAAPACIITIRSQYSASSRK